VKRLDPKRAIDVRPWQTPGLLAQTHLSAEETRAAAWFVDTTGRAYRGAGAIVNGLAAINRIFAPLAWLYRLPGLRQIMDSVYSLVAANRHRLPGATDSCALPPKT
jgi:predicted DCC family thiol-disulfide oxidoreductase YuxK